MILQPQIGDIVNPDGDILALVDDVPQIVARGIVQMGYKKGLMALRHRWHVLEATDEDLIIGRL